MYQILRDLVKRERILADLVLSRVLHEEGILVDLLVLCHPPVDVREVAVLATDDAFKQSVELGLIITAENQLLHATIVD